jgi:hypothetical protein
MIVKTVKVLPWDGIKTDYVVINESDFDPKKHKKFTAKKVAPKTSTKDANKTDETSSAKKVAPNANDNG